MLFWMFAKLIATQRGLLLRDVTLERLCRAIPLERGLVLGAAFILLGLTAFMAAVFEWSTVGFGQLAGGAAMRLVITAGTTFVLGTQILYGSFFLYVLEYRATPRRQGPIPEASPEVSDQTADFLD
jgi:hypothetical protein